MSSSSHHVSPCELSGLARRLPRLRAPTNSTENIAAAVCRIVNCAELISVVRLSGGMAASKIHIWEYWWWVGCLCDFIQKYLHTGCPVKLSTLRFCYFLGFQITYKRTSDHFSIAQKIRISKLTLLYFLREKFIKLQDEMRDKLDFDSIILMADFVPS